MKDKIIIFVIGVLVGAVISTASFYVYSTTNVNTNTNFNAQMNGGQQISMPGGQNGDSSSVPEKPSDNQSMEKTSDEITSNS